MKKRLFIAAAMLALMLCGCSNGQMEEVNSRLDRIESELAEVNARTDSLESAFAKIINQIQAIAQLQKQIVAASAAEEASPTNQ